MGILNILKGSWTGKVGETVGAKWKNKNTIRTYTKPAYSDSPAQQVVRTVFGEMNAFTALFTDQLKPLSALDTKAMSVRNAITKLNKDQIDAGTFDPTTLKVSRGGLPQPATIAVTAPAGLASINATWSPIVGATISQKCRVVVIVVDAATGFALVGSALNSVGTLSIPATVPPSTTFDVYAYALDFRGSSRVASQSLYKSVTSPAS